MNWYGKVIGGALGLLMGGPAGAVLGAAVGHQFDRRYPAEGLLGLHFGAGDQGRVQTAFYTATFAVMGHVAKADGRVSEAEIAAARTIMSRMDLSEEIRKRAVSLFTEGKQPDFPLAAVLEQFRSECNRRYSLVRVFIEIQLEAALADGALRVEEERLLLEICDRLRFSRFEFHAIRAALEAQLRVAGAWRQAGGSGYSQQRTGRDEPSLADAYAALGVKASSSAAEIKRAYRRMISQHHPDKLVASGLPEEMVKLANEKTRQIRQAYEIICKHRKLKS